jgi:hypothetical protein
MTRGELIALALGDDESNKVDTAIPQSVFDAMTSTARDDIAGWYYAPECHYMGRLLTQTECWRQIIDKLNRYQLRATMLGHDVSFIVTKWDCLRAHCERGEIQIERETPTLRTFDKSAEV